MTLGPLHSHSTTHLQSFIQSLSRRFPPQWRQVSSWSQLTGRRRPHSRLNLYFIGPPSASVRPDLIIKALLIAPEPPIHEKMMTAAGTDDVDYIASCLHIKLMVQRAIAAGAVAVYRTMGHETNLPVLRGLVRAWPPRRTTCHE